MYQLSALYYQLISRLRNDEGATAVEYGLMVALIAAVIVVTVTTLGTKLDGEFQKIVAAL